MINRLEQNNYIVIGNYNKHRYDKTRWFALNLEEVDKLESVTVVWGGGMIQGCFKMKHVLRKMKRRYQRLLQRQQPDMMMD